MLNSENEFKVLDDSPIEYTSIYGYPKRRFMVRDMTSGQDIGCVKEEKVIAEDGSVSCVMFYERNGWKGRAQQRFYQTAIALIIAMGGKVWSEPKLVQSVKPRRKAVAKKKPSRKTKAPVKKPARKVVKKVVAKKRVFKKYA